MPTAWGHSHQCNGVCTAPAFHCGVQNTHNSKRSVFFKIGFYLILPYAALQLCHGQLLGNNQHIKVSFRGAPGAFNGGCSSSTALLCLAPFCLTHHKGREELGGRGGRVTLFRSCLGGCLNTKAKSSFWIKNKYVGFFQKSGISRMDKIRHGKA